jgi:polysaccharide pyruvyl transferase WcaK-like protein
MRIVIDCANYFAHDSVNLGDVAVMCTMRDRLLECFPHCTIDLFTSEPATIERHVPGVRPVKVSDTSTRRPDATHPDFAQTASDCVTQADLVLLSGGGFFSDEFAAHAIALLETLALAQQRNIPTAVMSPGFELVEHGELRSLAQRVLPQVGLIGCRERLVAPGVLRSFGVSESRIVVTGDDAIQSTERPRVNRSIEAIGFNLRRAHYSGVDDAAASAVAAAIGRAAAHLGRPICVIPINLDNPSDGNATLDALAHAGVVAHPLPLPRSLEAVFAALDLCRVLVTGSYHAAVFALARGIPAVTLASSDHYRQKFFGLADQFGCPVIDISRDPGTDLTDAIVEAWTRAEITAPPLRAVADGLIAVQRAFWYRLIDIVAGHKIGHLKVID